MSKPPAAFPVNPVCPWWLIWTFDNPLRRLVQKPERFLHDLARPGDACLDLGCGIGYFTIPLARLVGPTGSVVAVDLQPRMLAGARRRAQRAGLLSRIHLLQADVSSLPLAVTFDFVMAFWMVHEVPDQAAMLRHVRALLKPGGCFALVEPRGHVRSDAFARTVRTAEAAGLATLRPLRSFFSHGVLMANPQGRLHD